MAMSPLFRGPDSIHGRMDNPTDKARLLLKRYTARPLRCGDDNVDLLHVQPHDYRVRQVGPYHRLSEVARRSP